MDIQKATAEYRLLQWAQIIKARQESGQTIKDFCQTAGISKYKYFYWQRKLREIACTELAKAEEYDNSTVPEGWIKLAPEPKQHMEGNLIIEINGCHIVVNNDTDSELIKKVVRVLKTL